MKRAFIIVDVQNDFCEGGSLAVLGGAAVAARISRHLAAHAGDYGVVAATQDWHIDPGGHFSDSPDFATSWPVHCVAHSTGAQFHPNLDTGPIQAVFRKGRWEAAYSGFEGFLAPGAAGEPGAAGPADISAEPGRGEPAGGPGMAEWLRQAGVTEVRIAGIATDHCVRATALDALGAGFDVTVLVDLTAGVSAGRTTAAVTEMLEAGAAVVESTAI